MHSGEPYWTPSRHDIARREGAIVFDIRGHPPDWKARGEQGSVSRFRPNGHIVGTKLVSDPDALGEALRFEGERYDAFD